MTLNGERCVDPATRVAAGAVVAVDEQAPRLRPGPLAEGAIVYFDRDLVVVDKPVGILSVADEPGNKATIVDYARTQLRRMGGHGVDGKLGVVHRLDRDTSGLMVFARTAHAQRTLAAQFRQHTIERVYHAIAHGAVTARRVETDLRPRPWRRPARLVRTSSGGRRATSRPTRGDPSRTSCRSRRSPVPRWSSAASKPDASTRSGSTCPNSAIRWSASACTSAITRSRDRRGAHDAPRANARLRASADG